MALKLQPTYTYIKLSSGNNRKNNFFFRLIFMFPTNLERNFQLSKIVPNIGKIII